MKICNNFMMFTVYLLTEIRKQKGWITKTTQVLENIEGCGMWGYQGEGNKCETQNPVAIL